MAYALMRFQRFFIHLELISAIHAPVLATREISSWPRVADASFTEIVRLGGNSQVQMKQRRFVKAAC